MKKMAITYRSNTMKNQLDCVEFFESGVEALRYFCSPMTWEEKPKQLGKNGIVVKHGFNSYHCRFLTDKEVKIYKKHGDNTHINHDTHQLCEPPKENEKH